MFVERDSRLDVMNQIYFLGNTLAYMTDSAWVRDCRARFDELPRPISRAKQEPNDSLHTRAVDPEVECRRSS